MAAYRRAGAELVALSPMTAEHARAFIDEHGLDFDIIVDPGNEIADAFGLRYQVPEELKQVYLDLGIDLAEANGDDDWTLPMPARYVIDPEGVVRWADVHADYTTRPEPDETLEAVRELG